jgi:hypothetical protein
MFSQLQSRIDTVWCGLMHESIMWPVHGHYECRTCGRRYPAFSEAQAASAPAAGALRLTTEAHRAEAWPSRV